MRDENSIVATSISIEEPVEAGGDYTVVLDGERRVRLDAADSSSAGYRTVLERLRRQRRPVYVEVDAARGAVRRLLVPHVTRVVRLVERGEELLVELVGSHAVHRVNLRQPDGPEMAETLRRAADSKEGLIVTEDESHYVLDVLAYTPRPDGPDLPPFPMKPVPEPEPPKPPFWRRWWFWLWWWLSCPSAGKVQQIFNQLGATSCPPLTVPAPCIPFMYPDNGCWARAHEMCRLVINTGRSPRKVWIFAGSNGILHVDTNNNPNCFVEWWYHVAPTLCVRTGWIKTQRMVLDPSMFTTPVPVATWHAAQHDPTASLVHTGPEQYGPYGGTDPTYSSTNADLATYRTALLNRSIQVGPPPYAQCP
ncbi:MAG TPA: protein-glutamine glutaminase family protein [Pseudonocardiaceae bacterium]|jgi:hypothetical protein